MDRDEHPRGWRGHPALAPLRNAWSYLRNDWVREAVRMRRLRPANLFQPYSFTAINRYPRCFAFARDTLGGDSPVALLSFGCATGEEVFTLARYFPHACVKGIDINARAIDAAKRAAPAADAGRIAFAVASTPEGEAPGSYDAAFAFAVFRHSALRAAPLRCDPLLRFVDFDRSVTALARCLKPGGLLFVRHAHFRFTDTAVARDFEVALTLETEAYAEPNPLYGPDDRLIAADAHTPEAAWRKLR